MKMIIHRCLQKTQLSLSPSVRYAALTQTYTQVHIKMLRLSKVFLCSSVCLFVVQLTPVNSTVFTVKATDADDDKIIYSIDQTSVSFTFPVLRPN